MLNYDAPFDLDLHYRDEQVVLGEGDAIIFVTNKEMRMLKAIERTLKVPVRSFPTEE